MMNPAAIEVLQCPLCQGAFELEGRSVRCAARHTFDLARQGYLNLLGGPEPGNADTAAMLGARERVHASGLFSEIGSRIAHLLTGQQRILRGRLGHGLLLAPVPWPRRRPGRNRARRLEGRGPSRSPKRPADRRCGG